MWRSISQFECEEKYLGSDSVFNKTADSVGDFILSLVLCVTLDSGGELGKVIDHCRTVLYSTYCNVDSDRGCYFDSRTCPNVILLTSVRRFTCHEKPQFSPDRTTVPDKLPRGKQ